MSVPMSNVPETFATADKKPTWHRFGHVISEDGQKDYMEGMKQAGLLFDVVKRQFQNPFLAEGCEDAPEIFSYGTFRTDTKHQLGACTKEYTVIQNVEAFGMLEELVGEGGMRFVSGGSFKKGAIVFANLLSGRSEVVKGDEVEHYVQVVTSHNGQYTLDFFTSLIQMICSNTMRMAMASANDHLRISHTISAVTKLKNMPEFLKLVGKQNESLTEKLRFLASKRLTKEVETLFLDQMIGKVEPEAQTKRRENMRAAILSAPDNSEVVTSIGGTFYSLLNKFTNTIDHGAIDPDGKKKATLVAEQEEKRAISASFGTKATDKTKALNVLLGLVNLAK